MPVLAPTPSVHAADICLWKAEETAMAQGAEGRQLREQIESVDRHWRHRSLDTVAGPDADLDELSNYRHVPLERVGTRYVRYVRINDLQPRKIVLDGDDP